MSDCCHQSLSHAQVGPSPRGEPTGRRPLKELAWRGGSDGELHWGPPTVVSGAGGDFAPHEALDSFPSSFLNDFLEAFGTAFTQPPRS